MKKGFLYLIVAKANNHHFPIGTLVECVGRPHEWACSNLKTGKDGYCAAVETEGLPHYPEDKDFNGGYGNSWNVGLDDVVEIGEV